MSPVIIGAIILVATVIAFFHPKVPNIPVAIAAPVAFVVTGILAPAQVFNSFTSTTCILMIGMMTIGGAMFRTGLAGWLGKTLMKITGTKKERVQLAVMLTTMCLAPFVTATATLMIMYPLMCSIAVSTKTSMSDIVFYQTTGSSAGSALTFTGVGMIATTAAVLEANGYRIWGFFEISYWGIPAKIIALVMVYFWANKIILKNYPFKEPDAVEVADATILPDKFTFKMGIVAGTLVLTLCGFIFAGSKLPPSVVATLGALVCLFSGCLTPKEMYKAVNWDTIILIGGMSAFARGIETSGLGKVVADSILGLTGANVSPMVVIFIILIVTGIITQFMSNNAAAALMAPIAITLAQAQGVSVHGYVMAALIGSHLCHLSIMASPSLAFMIKLGGYDNKFLLKSSLLFELPANLLAAMVMIPIVYF